MLALAGLFTILLISSFSTLHANELDNITPCTQEQNINTTENNFFDSVYDALGLSQRILTDEEKKGLTTQQQAFEQCLKDALQTKRSLDFYLRITVASSILLAAVSTGFIIREYIHHYND